MLDVLMALFQALVPVYCTNGSDHLRNPAPCYGRPAARTGAPQPRTLPDPVVVRHLGRTLGVPRKRSIRSSAKLLSHICIF